jgi:hypothetical protein
MFFGIEDPYKFWICCLIFFLTDIMVWFQIVVLLAIPIGLGYFYAWQYGVEGLGSWWACRLVGFGITFAVFPVLTHVLLGESIFKPKTMISVFLSIVIVLIQVMWPSEKNIILEEKIKNNAQKQEEIYEARGF